MICRTLENGELFTIDTDSEYLKFRCCDCGLVHLIELEISGSVVEFRLYRDERSTSAVRAWKTKKGSWGSVEVRKSDMSYCPTNEEVCPVS